MKLFYKSVRFIENRGKINNFEFTNLFVSFNGKCKFLIFRS